MPVPTGLSRETLIAFAEEFKGLSQILEVYPTVI
jgi:hypothetical protein